MNTLTRICAILCTLALLLAAPACNSDPHAALYGKWQQDTLSDSNLPIYWEFGSDGSFVISSGEARIAITYTFINDSTIQFEKSDVLTIGGVPITWKVEGDALTLTYQGQDATFTRVK